MYIREDEADIRLTVWDISGNPHTIGDGNSWTSYDGAELEAAGAKTRAGGMGHEIELGGPASRSDCTIEIQNSEAMVGQHPFMESRIGKGRALIVVTYLDSEGNVLPGAQFRITGKVKKSSLPGQKFDSANVGMYTVVVGADEKAA